MTLRITNAEASRGILLACANKAAYAAADAWLRIFNFLLDTIEQEVVKAGG